MAQIQDFSALDLRTGVIVSARTFPEARKPAYILEVDFGPEIGTLKTSAQITDLYSTQQLLGEQVVGIVNIPSRQIGPIQSQFLVLGALSGNGVVLLDTKSPCEPGTKIA